MNRHWGARLGDVAEFVRGLTYKPSDVLEATDTGAIPCMRTKNIQRFLEVDDLVYIPDRLVRADRQLIEGDILVSSANSWNLVGKCCWVPDLEYQATFGGFTSVLRANRRRIDPRYLYHWFSWDKTQAVVRSFGQQTTNISNLNQNRCLELAVLLPPLDEQRRIAAILDKADALRQKRKRAIALLGSLTQSIFLEMFGDVLSNSKGWMEGPTLQDVADIGSGITKGRPDKGLPVREVPYMAVLNVQDRYLDFSTVKTIEATEAEIAKFRLQPGDILLTEGGDPDKLGRGSLWRGELTEAIHQNHVFRVRVTSNDVTPLFVNWLVGSERGKRYFLKSAKQTTGIASINKTQLSHFPMLLPPTSLQAQFVRAAESIASRAGQLTVASARLEQAFASLQHRAFSGQL